MKSAEPVFLMIGGVAGDSFTDAKNMALRANDQHVHGDRWGCHHDFPHHIFLLQLILGPRFDNVDFTILVNEIDSTIGRDRRCAECAAAAEPRAVHFVTSLDVVDIQDAIVSADVHVASVHNRGHNVRLRWILPGDMSSGQLAFGRRDIPTSPCSNRVKKSTHVRTAAAKK